jgi:hypothetical protein
MTLWRQRTFPVSGRRRAPTPADVVAIAVVVVATVGLAVLQPRGGRAVEALVRCSDGERRVRLDVDQVLTCEGPLGQTVLSVEDGRIAIVEAPCRLQLCRRMGSTNDPSRSLVCIPNRVQVRILSGPAGEADVDARSR